MSTQGEPERKLLGEEEIRRTFEFDAAAIVS